MTPPPAAERAYAHLKQRILSGAVPGGTLLSEVQVGAELGISRTPVHEAFLRLAAEELLTLSARRGAVVVPISAGEVRDVLEVRAALEVASAARIVEDGLAPDVVPLLDAAIEGMRAYPASADLAAFVEADDAFHAAVVEGARNAVTTRVHAQVRDRQQRLRHHLLTVRPGDAAGALADHVALADALRREDATAYARVLDEHLARYRGAL